MMCAVQDCTSSLLSVSLLTIVSQSWAASSCKGLAPRHAVYNVKQSFAPTSICSCTTEPESNHSLQCCAE
jgi:hypothetical protein